MAFSSVMANAAEKLYVYNWTEYVPSSLLEQFTKETGIEVIYSTFESNEEMYSKLKLSNSTGYDIVFPSSYYVGKMVMKTVFNMQSIQNAQIIIVSQAYFGTLRWEAHKRGYRR